MAEDPQEKYLTETSFKDVIIRGMKKITTEATSVKFLLLVFVCVGLWKEFIPTIPGLSTALLLVGLKDIPVDQILKNLTGKKGEE